MYKDFKTFLQQELQSIQDAGLFKQERTIASAQGAEITLANGKKVLNFCANNYLGLSAHPRVVEAAKKALDQRGYGMSSVRFICGTQDLHQELEAKLSAFLGTEDTILYAAAFDANGGIFEPLLGAEDAIISDELNHASIIDGVRLCKAQRFRYKNNDMADLEAQLIAAKNARFRMIVTDGVFSMDGYIANLPAIAKLAEKYDALLMVDDSHATGFMGENGRGTHEHHGVIDKIDVLTGTLGKALGGAMGGYTSGKKEIIALLRQRSRPYLFSNALSPAIVGAALEVLDLLKESKDLMKTLHANTSYFRKAMTDAGFDLKMGEHPIVPVMLYDAKVAQSMAKELLEEGVYVVGFFYPVVPKDQARIRVQISAAHTKEQIEKTVQAFVKVSKRLGVIK
jgi:glycine C-acetyltransferase